jgi:hypothetical protein
MYKAICRTGNFYIDKQCVKTYIDQDVWVLLKMNILFLYYNFVYNITLAYFCGIYVMYPVGFLYLLNPFRLC